MLYKNKYDPELDVKNTPSELQLSPVIPTFKEKSFNVCLATDAP